MVVPEQLFAVGVIVIVALIGKLVPLVAVKDGTMSDPLAANPIEVLLFVQVKLVPETGPVNIVALVIVPLQYT